MRFVGICSFLIAICCAGCADMFGPPVHADLSTPKSAALEYLRALQRGDAHTARVVSIGTREQKEWVTAMAVMIDGMRKYVAACDARFHILDQMRTDLVESIRVMADEPVALTQDGSTEQDGDTAKINLPRRGFTSKSQPPVVLTHQNDGWHVDLTKTYSPEVSPKDFGPIDETYRAMRNIGQAFAETANQIRAGQYRSPTAAEHALGVRIKDVAGK